MSLEEAIKAKFGKNVILHPLPTEGCFVVLDKKMKIMETKEKTRLSANIRAVPAKKLKGVDLYNQDVYPFASIVSESDHNYMILFDCKKNISLIKEMLNLL